MRQQGPQRDDLLAGQVAAVVDDDVDSRHLLHEATPEPAVCLIADEDPDVVAFVRPTGVLDVHSVDVAASAKIVLPHGEASTAEDADLHDMDLSADELGKVSVIDLEVVAPFPNAWTLGVRIEVGLQRIRAPVGGAGRGR